MHQSTWKYLLTVSLTVLLWMTSGAQPPSEVPWTLPPRALERPSGVRELTLTETLELGMSQNPQMKLAAERVEQARATYLQAKSQKVPRLILTNTTRLQPETSIKTGNLLGDFARGPLAARASSFPDRFVLMSPVTNEFMLSLQTLLTTFGRVENQIAAAFLQIDAESASVEIDRMNLAYAVKQAFFAKLQAEATVEVSRLNLTVANQNLDDTKALFEQGVMARYDILQAEIEVTNAVQDLSQNLTDVDNAAASLANVLAERTFHVKPVSPPAPFVASDIDLVVLENFALAHRPEMVSIAYNRAVADKLLEAARDESKPSLVLAANYQTHLGQSLSPVDLPSLNLQLQWSLFDGGLRKAKILEAESVLRELSALEQEVESSWLDFKQTAFTLATAEKQVANSLEYHDMARRRYLNGLATTLEVAEAVRNLVAARTALVEASYLRDLAFARLEKSLGRDVPERHLTSEFLQSVSKEKNDV